MGETLIDCQGETPVPVCQIMRLEGADLDAYWNEIVEELRLIRHTWDMWWTEEALYESAMDGRVQVWAAGTLREIRLIVFTYTIDYPAGRVLHIGPVFGRDLGILIEPMGKVLVGFSQMTGCRLIEATGREGWERVLKPWGVRRNGVSLVLEVQGDRRH